MARSRNRNQKRNQRVSRRRVQSRRNSQSRKQSRSRNRSQSRNRNARRSKRVRHRSRGGSDCVSETPTVGGACNFNQKIRGIKYENLLCKKTPTGEYKWQEATEDEINSDNWHNRHKVNVCGQNTYGN